MPFSSCEKLIILLKDAQNKYSKENLVLSIPKFMSKSFNSYCSMRDDLITIKKYIQLLETEKDIIISSALTYSSISLYGRCFTDASNSKSPKLESSHIFNENSIYKRTHDYLMDLRHNFIAHRGETDSEISLAYILIPKQNGQLQVKYAQTKKINLDTEKKTEIQALVDHILDFLIIKIEKSAEKIYKSFFEQFTSEEINLMLLNNLK